MMAEIQFPIFLLIYVQFKLELNSNLTILIFKLKEILQ